MGTELYRKAAVTMAAALWSLAATAAATDRAALTPVPDRALHGQLAVDQGQDKLRGRAVYAVLLDEPPVALYAGGTRQLAATSPEATGAARLDVRSSAVRAYADYLRGRQDAVLADLASALRTEITPVYRYVYALNGFALRLSEKDAATARGVAGVARVVRDSAHRYETDRGPALIGAPSIWDGTATGVGAQGEGMVVGIMDSGINQGHPSFAEIGDDGYGASGEYAATNPFGAGNFAGGDRDDCSNPAFPGLCNNKLIGSHAFLDANGGDDPFAPPGDPLSKDTDGHGSHVASTAAGNVLIDPPLLDADGNDSGLTLGTVSGVAPHAHVIAYRVCAPSCFGSDIAAAIDQAIVDGADALNHSIGAAAGSPWEDLKSLAFKGARAAGIMLQNSAGNSGPTAGTAGRINAAPWTTAVAASTHDRAFPAKSLTNMTGGDTPPPAEIPGRSVTEGFTGPIVYAGDYPVGAPGDTNFDQPEQCLEPFPAGTFSSDQIVVCDRGAIARVQKARNVRDGGAGALVLANTQGGATSTNDDLHVIPAIHIAADDADVLRAWLASGSGHTATITGSGPAFADPDAADILAGFSSRGPYTGFDWLAPHVAAPGVAIYAAGADLQFDHGGFDTPDPNDDPSVQAAFGIISGTSMASPHATGAATLLKQLRPELTPAEILSVLLTTGVTAMRKEDGATPADPFDYGGGRVNLQDAARAALVLDETIANFDAADPELGGDPATLNLAAFVSNTCILDCGWTRTVRNASDAPVAYAVSAVADGGMVLSVSPSSFTLDPGAEQVIAVDADTTLANVGWNFGQIVLTPAGGPTRGVQLPEQRLPVAALFTTASNPNVFVKQVSDDPASVGQTITYQLDLTNVAETGAYTLSDPLPANATLVPGSATAVITGGSDITPFGLDAGSNAMVWSGTLDTGLIDVVSDPFPPAGSPFGYVSLPGIGVSPLGCSSVCDDTLTTLSGLPPFTYVGTTYTSLVISSNGYIVAGDDSTSAFTPSNQSLPDGTAPNNVIAPFWTDIDMDGTAPDDSGAGIWYAGVFNSGQFILIEWNGVERWNEPGPTYTFQIQIGTDLAPAGFRGIWFVYNELPSIPDALTVGAESEGGLFGDNYFYDGSGDAPITGDLGDLRVNSEAGGTGRFTFDMVVDGPVGEIVLNAADVSSASVNETAIAITEIAIIDADGDGVEDFEDNCTLAPNVSQCDSDGDGYGNHCDADFNNSGFVNYLDLGLLRRDFMGPSDPPEYSELDLNCDGNVNISDLGVFRTLFGTVPGPSANE